MRGYCLAFAISAGPYCFTSAQPSAICQVFELITQFSIPRGTNYALQASHSGHTPFRGAVKQSI
jgi:hypothetical protein